MRWICFLVWLSYCSATFAGEWYSFSSDEQRMHFQYLTRQFRCLVCQNEDLASSHASLAKDLRHQIYHLLKKGETDQQIFNYMIARYGHFILFRPPWILQTMLLWTAPFPLLLMGGILFTIIVRVASKLQVDTDVKS